jgi:hypothetical protein
MRLYSSAYYLVKIAPDLVQLQRRGVETAPLSLEWSAAAIFEPGQHLLQHKLRLEEGRVCARPCSKVRSQSHRVVLSYYLSFIVRLVEEMSFSIVPEPN